MNSKASITARFKATMAFGPVGAQPRWRVQPNATTDDRIVEMWLSPVTTSHTEFYPMSSGVVALSV